MVRIKCSKGIKRFSVSTRLYEVLMRIKEKMHDEDDMVLGIVWGRVGGGKSVTVQRMAFVVDRSLEGDVDRTAFDKNEFIDAVIKCRKQAIIGDEGISLFFSRASMTKEGRMMGELMAQIRQKNLFVLVCVPSLTSLDGLILEAANFVAYVWESAKTINGKKVTIKGNMALYPAIAGDDFKTRMIHYLRMKKRNPQAKVMRPDPYLVEPGNPVTQHPWYPVSEEEYREKKESILLKYKIKKEPPKLARDHLQSIKKNILQEIICKAKEKNPELTDGEIAKVLGYTRQRVNTLRNEGVKANSEPN